MELRQTGGTPSRAGDRSGRAIGDCVAMSLGLFGRAAGTQAPRERLAAGIAARRKARPLEYGERAVRVIDAP
jgi:hypothetical protein